MRVFAVLPVLALGLASCGAEPEQAENTLTQEEVSAQIENLPDPVPGLYRRSTELLDFSIEGMSAEQVEQMKQEAKIEEGDREYCLTQADADKGYRDIVRGFSEAQQGMTCKFSEFSANGADLKAQLACDAAMGISAKVAIAGTAQPESSDMNMDMTLGLPFVGDMDVKLRLQSERIGDCP